MRRVSCRMEGSPCAARPGLLRMKSACVASLYSTSVVGPWLLVVGNAIPCHPVRRIIVRSRCYFSRRSLVFGRWPYPDPVIPSKESSFACERRFGVEGPCVSAWDDGLLDVNQRPTTDSDPYPGLSRCTTFTRYPAVRKRFETSSAIMTDRCCPPVQPKEIVR